LANSIVQSESDIVRNHVIEKFIKPTIQRGETVITVNVGTVHKTLGLHNRVPLVCAALKSKKFLDENGLRILSTTGPPSGQSTTVTFTYEILRENARSAASANPLIAIRGLAKELFKDLGGGEHFIREERNNFAGDRVK